jgi:protein SCO1/2
MRSLLLVLVLAACLPAQPNIVDDKLPEDLEAAQIDEQLGAQLPLDLPFTDSEGNPVTLRTYWTGERPVILTLNYYRCPMLCTLVLNGLVSAVQQLDLDLGRDYEIVTVSFDHREGPELAAAKKHRYVQTLQRPGGKQHWHFLVGSEESIETLCQTVGFGFQYIPPARGEEIGQYAHQAAIFVTTPTGVVSRCLYGIEFEEETLRLSMVEASDGVVGSPLDRIILYCYHYDPSSGVYSPAAFRIMQLGGAVTLLLLGLMLVVLWRRELRRRRAGVAEGVR